MTERVLCQEHQVLAGDVWLSHQECHQGIAGAQVQSPWGRCGGVCPGQRRQEQKLKRSSRREWNKMVPCRSHQVQSGGAAGRHQVNRESLVGDQVQSPWGQVGGVRCNRMLTVVRNFRHFCRSVQYGDKIFLENLNLI